MEDILVEIAMEVAEAIAETALKKVNDKKQKKLQDAENSEEDYFRKKPKKRYRMSLSTRIMRCQAVKMANKKVRENDAVYDDTKKTVE